MEKIPIIIGGETLGAGTLSREGAYMRFTGSFKGPGSAVRLWLYGRGRPVYLGLSIPEGDDRRISKRFSLADFKALGQPVTHCGDEQLREAVPEKAPGPEDVLWYALSDGTLQTVENGRTFLAFPVENQGFSTPDASLLRTIEGKRYIIFPW